MVKAGIIGLGRMGAEPSKRLEGKVPNGWLPISHIEAMLATKHLQVHGISDVNEERMDWVDRYYDLKTNQFHDPEVLFETIKPELISIATRTQVRHDLIIMSLDNGVKAIMAEKPLTNSIALTTNLIKRLKEEKVLLGYGAARRAMDIYRKAKEIMQSGELGQLQSITAEFGYTKLLWSLPHAVDLFLFFADSTELEYISGHCTIEQKFLTKSNYDGDPLVETATVKFKNGIIANIVPTDGLNIRLGCSAGIITIHGDGDYIEINRVGRFESYFTHSDKIENNYTRSGICNIYSALVESLEKHLPFDVISLEEIETNQQILSAIIQSSIQNGRRLSVGELDKDFFITGRSGVLFA